MAKTRKAATPTPAEADAMPGNAPAAIVEQREGRILRQGNGNDYRYVTEGSFDASMWQALETKERFISQVMTGDNAARRAEDIGGQELSYAEVKAIARIRRRSAQAQAALPPGREILSSSMPDVQTGNRGLTGVNSVYRFRAECQPDVDKLLRLLGARFERITIVNSPPFPDVEVELVIGLSLEELRDAMRRVVDGHVMVQTVARRDEYTGERNYDL